MRHLLFMCALFVSAALAADEVSTNNLATGSVSTNEVAAQGVRNPFWPMGYEGERETISPNARPKPKPKPASAKAGGARIVATGRSDYPNQVNNVLAFPGVFRGTFDVRASDINEAMKLAAAKALSDLVSDEELNEEYILPKAFDPRVGKAVAAAVSQAARDSGVARI